MTLSKMWHKPDGWSEQGPCINSWVQDLPTHFLKRLWDLLMDDSDADLGCFLLEAVQLEMQYRGEGYYVVL
jgi:hypothetical protein